MEIRQKQNIQLFATLISVSRLIASIVRINARLFTTKTGFRIT